mmetsp:Transcript_140450/g.365225  ORF Transcript_140450/g.365225 Transcript_140450/m.365225 type:complete len:225 (-) Transcript_140450:222-896(-)
MQESSTALPADASTGEVMEKMMLTTINSMCDHEIEIQCYLHHSDVCRRKGGGPDPFVDLSSHMRCFCGACPSLKASYAKFMGTLTDLWHGVAMSVAMSMGGNLTGDGSVSSGLEVLQDKLWEALCQMQDSVACISSNTAQCDASMFSTVTNGAMDVGGLMNNATALKLTRETKGFSTDPSPTPSPTLSPTPMPTPEEEEAPSADRAAWASPVLLSLGTAIVSMA